MPIILSRQKENACFAYLALQSIRSKRKNFKMCMLRNQGLVCYQVLDRATPALEEVDES